LGYFNQSLIGLSQNINGVPTTYGASDRFTGFQIGLSIPLFGVKSQLSTVKAIEMKKQETEAHLEAISMELNGQLQELLFQYQKYLTSLDYYQQNALPQADLILAQAQKGFESGSIGYIEYVQGISQAISIKFTYLETLNNYNQTIIQLEFVSGIQ